MKRLAVILVSAIVFAAGNGAAQQPPPGGPYKVLKTARVGGEGSWDYIYADADGRRLYIPRRGSAANAANGAPAVPTRLTIFDLDTLAPIGEIPEVGGNGTAIDPKSGHGFTSSRPVSMFETKTMKLIKTIDVAPAQPDGIVFDAFNQRVYTFSHPTKDATVIDAKDGTVLGKIDLGGVPEQGVPDGKGMLYVVMQDPQGSVAVVDVTTMKTTTHYPFNGHGGCNGLALDAKNRVLFAACRLAGQTGDQTQPAMVILSATDGKIFTTLPLPSGSDGAAFNPATLEAYATQSNGSVTIVKEKSPTSFEIEQNVATMNGARTIAFDSKTGHIFTMSQERGPAPPPPANAAPGARAPQGTPVPGSFTILMVGK